jgi:hypothetical protein
MSENRVLAIIFERKRDVVTGDWRELNNEKPHNLYTALRQILRYQI